VVCASAEVSAGLFVFVVPQAARLSTSSAAGMIAEILFIFIMVNISLYSSFYSSLSRLFFF
jgi:hypothetical protein